MTYPPQQPGPYGQQNPWGQPPPQGPGPFPQQPPSPTPPWLTNDPGGFPSFEPDPKKPRGGLIAVVVIVALLVLGGGGFGLWMLLSKDDSTSNGGGGGGGGGEGGADARAVAEQYVEELEATVNTEIEDIELSSMEPLTCADDFQRMEQEIGDAQANGDSAPTRPGSIEIGMKDFQSTEDKGSFLLTQKVDGKEGPDQEMTMAKEDGDWKVCGLYDGSSAPADPSEEPGEDEPTDDGPASGGQVPNPIPTT